MCASSQIIDAVVAARILNATLVVPKLDQTSFWKDARFFRVPTISHPSLLGLLMFLRRLKCVVCVYTISLHSAVTSLKFLTPTGSSHLYQRM